jgi:hypothetical protein
MKHVRQSKPEQIQDQSGSCGTPTSNGWEGRHPVIEDFGVNLFESGPALGALDAHGAAVASEGTRRFYVDVRDRDGWHRHVAATPFDEETIYVLAGYGSTTIVGGNGARTA